MTDDELKGLLEAMRAENAEARQENAAMHAAAGQENAGMYAAARQENAGMYAAARQENAGMYAAARQENAAMHAETRRHVNAVVERMEGRFELLAETVQLVNENLQTKIVALDQKFDKTTAR